MEHGSKSYKILELSNYSTGRRTPLFGTVECCDLKSDMVARHGEDRERAVRVVVVVLREVG